MARNLRLTASVSALVFCSLCGSAFAQQQGKGQLTVPFSSLSASAQQEILALQNGIDHGAVSGTPTDPLLFPVQEPVARNAAVPVPVQSLSNDGRRARTNWTIGVYR